MDKGQQTSDKQTTADRAVMIVSIIVAVLLINFLVDVLYLLIDPRLRAGAR